MLEAKKTYHQELKGLLDEYVHLVYKLTRSFPKEELFGIVSQWRRSSLSIALNYVEGFARVGVASNKNFLKISFGSLKESQYLLEFSFVEKYIAKEDYEKAKILSNRIGAMLWGILKKM